MYLAKGYIQLVRCLCPGSCGNVCTCWRMLKVLCPVYNIMRSVSMYLCVCIILLIQFLAVWKWIPGTLQSQLYSFGWPRCKSQTALRLNIHMTSEKWEFLIGIKLVCHVYLLILCIIHECSKNVLTFCGSTSNCTALGHVPFVWTD